MWFRDSKGTMRLILRNDFNSDSEYYNFIAKL